MHEYSVVASLMELCEEHARAHGAMSVQKVVVSIGERAGMDRSLFESAFEAFKLESEVCKESELEIVLEGVELSCRACGHRFSPQGMEYGECEQCQSSDLEMTKGKEMYLMSLELCGEGA